MSSHRQKIYAWSLYDWANSTFSTTIMAGFFPVFFSHYWSTGVDSTMTTARLGSVISASSLLIAVTSPLLGALADLRGQRKMMCFLFMLLGVLSSAWMAIIPSGSWLQASWAYGLAMMGFFASAVFYDSLLPSIAKRNETHFASSLGYSLGYLGGGVLFAINVAMYLQPQWFGLRDATQSIKASFVSVAVWWFVFSLPMFIIVPEPMSPDLKTSLGRSLFHSVKKLFATLALLLRTPNTKVFLLAYWLYIDGVYTVMTMAVNFGLSIGLQPSDLIAALLIVQFIGFPFTLLFAKMANKLGSRLPILICLGAYSIAIVLAANMTQAWHFYSLAAFIGAFQGGVQALSRSLFVHMIPSESAGEYFGLFNLVGKFASILGPILVGWGSYLLGSSRYGLMGLLALFLLGGILLYQVQEPEKDLDTFSR